MKCSWFFLPAVLIFLSLVEPASSNSKLPLIGDTEQVFTLAEKNTEIRGLDVDNSSEGASQLFVLDGSARIFIYRLSKRTGPDGERLEVVRCVNLPNGAHGGPPAGSRGLAHVVENGEEVIYFLNWRRASGHVKSELWQFNLDQETSSVVDLSLHFYHIGDRETFDLAFHDSDLFISYDASDQMNHDLRVQRGIIQLRRGTASDQKFQFVRHLPDSGTMPARGLACMGLEGSDYLWATSGNDHIFCADGETGQGLFFFARPTSVATSQSCWGLAFGNDCLWVSEHVTGPDRVHCVNVTRNLDSAREGPRVLRHLVMTIDTQPEREGIESGKVYHCYCRPYAYEQLHSQGVWPQTERVLDTSSTPSSKTETITIDPAGDTSSRQYMSLITYGNGPAHADHSRYEVDFWTNPYRKFVYPCRANRDMRALQGTDYLADDPHLYNLSDTKTYDDFVARVRAHIKKKYGLPANLENPYWAARNVLEYIQDHYYYPNRSKRIPATVDYDRQHYDANPGNLKLELSHRRYDQSQIIACSGTSVMLVGVMRYLGIPARWLGTGTEQSAATWDTNENGLLDADESASCTNGHRYTQVWLGSHYGWTCFDATPKKPPLNDYDAAPPVQTQWRYMNRSAAGHREDKRIVFNVGSGLYRTLYRDFVFDKKLALDNNCGGDQRYNLQGRFDNPKLWKRARHRIVVENLCFIEQVKLAGPSNETRVTWTLKGAWSRDHNAAVSLYVQPLDDNNHPCQAALKVANAIACTAKSAVVDLSAVRDARFRMIIRKDGDPETGGQSKPLDFNQIFDFEQATRNVPKPREIWPLVKKYTVPLNFKVLSDELVTSQTDPCKRLRKVTAHFYSQQLAGKKWGHPCVILMPADNLPNMTPQRKGKVVIVSSPADDYFPIHVDKLGDPIATRTGYPTMVLSNPGLYDDGTSIERDIRILGTLRQQTGKNYFNMNCQLAVVYIQAMNAFQQFLGLDDLKAILGGHSKRGRSATVAAAMDSRVASPIIMGNEGVYATDRVQWHLPFHHAFFQDQVHVPVFYLGATNEDGYKMFNVEILQQRLKRPMTVEMIPNYCHSNFSEIQYMDFLMWVAHVFDNRPVSHIEDVRHERQDRRTVFRAKIRSDARIQMVRAWYVYSDDPAWRDLMWYHLLMHKRGDHYEAVLYGKLPDAFMIEVGDTAQGIPGYVSSLPHKLTDAPVIERHSRGSLPRLWEP